MKALSIRQPWAWAITHLGKTIENRDWRGCSYRGPILIHASNWPPPTAKESSLPMHDLHMDAEANSREAARIFGEGRESCHLTTDGDIEELHAFAEKIGLRRAWFQPHRLAPHYDLTPKRRAAAVKAGAVEVSAREQARRRRGRVTPASPG